MKSVVEARLPVLGLIGTLVGFGLPSRFSNRQLIHWGRSRSSCGIDSTLTELRPRPDGALVPLGDDVRVRAEVKAILWSRAPRLIQSCERRCSLVLHECPCGFHTHPRTECTCSLSIVARYQKKISGPLLDRVDVFAEVPPVEYEKLVDEEPAEDSCLLRKRVENAREIQSDRFKELGFLCNSEMGPAEVWQFCKLDDTAKTLLQAATQRLNFSARAFHRILKVSRTIADLENTGEIAVAHLAEALQYRSRGLVS